MPIKRTDCRGSVVEICKGSKTSYQPWSYVQQVFEEFLELHGDRAFRDDGCR
ncbi:MAG: hypothetical protein ACLUTZ_09630 [Oliverpabstia sp.]